MNARTRPRSGPDKRRSPRDARRIPCELFIRGERHTGIVKDISRGGVFVQTRAKAAVGAPVTLVFAQGAGRTEIRVTGRVVRSDHSRAHLAMQSTIGIGIEVMEMGSLGRLLHDRQLAGGSSELSGAAES